MKDQDIHPWLTRMIQGDSEAFRYVYEATSDHVYRTLDLLLNNREDADDVMNEVYMQLFKSLPSYQTTQPFRPWLNGLLMKQASNWRRKQWRKGRLLERLKLFQHSGHDQAVADDAFQAEEQRLEMMNLINRLSYKLREVIVLKYYQHCTLEEIAEVLQLPLGTVKSRQHAALRKLRQLTEQQGMGKGTIFHAD
ncbi:sigma-70 family RNA polymerase sigma factor [Paenibacillus algorifonticola]|uniref:sigma-70 family RNA polymerase sigma factor n=1 Tax=Paenibacillus algorifonticola TaxID=684063 RepID=UPI003D267BE0